MTAIFPGFRPETLAWKAAALAEGGAVSNDTLHAVDRLLVRYFMRRQMWHKFHMIDPCCGNFAASLVRLKVPAGVSRLSVNHNFVSGDYAENAGMTGGAPKYLNLGLNPVALGWSETSLMLWCFTRTANVSAGVSRVSMGASTDNVTISVLLGWVASGSRESVGVAAYQGGGSATGSPTPLTGLLGGGTNGSKSQQFYANGVAVGSPATAISTLPNTSLYKFANSNGGAAADHTPRTLSSSFITAGLSPSEVEALFGGVHAFETALGEGCVVIWIKLTPDQTRAIEVLSESNTTPHFVTPLIDTNGVAWLAADVLTETNGVFAHYAAALAELTPSDEEPDLPAE